MRFWTVLVLVLLLVWAVLFGAWRLVHTRAWRVAEREVDEAGPPLPVVLALAVAVIGAGAVVFLLLARAWQAGPPLLLDQGAAALAREAWSSTAQYGVLAVTHLGDPLALWGWGLLVGVWLLRRREIVLLVAWVVALGGNAAWNPLLKGIYERLRPEADLSGLAAPGYSFPSGHSSGAMVTYGMLAYLAWRLLPARWHLPALFAAAALIVAIGASRVYLQAHFLSDVLAGFASGSAWLALCIAACAAWQAARGRRN